VVTPFSRIFLLGDMEPAANVIADNAAANAHNKFFKLPNWGSNSIPA